MQVLPGSRKIEIGAVVGGFELHRLLKLFRRYLVMAGAILQKPEAHVSLGAGAAQIDSLSARFLCPGDPRFLLGIFVGAPVGFAESRLSLAIVRIDL